jgi:hypothetical protein
VGKPIGEVNGTPSGEPDRGEERLTGLPLDPATIKQLVLEAEIRGMRIGKIFAALILAIIKNDLFHLIRDHSNPRVGL